MSVPSGRTALPYSGYYRAAKPPEDAELTHVGPGSDCGEYLRLFWHPVCLSQELTDVPVPLRIMGEELVVFRDLSGSLGVLHRHCSHRRASLEYGRLERRGIRCCYHGWLFDVDGTILETPGEPEDSPIRHTLCHGSYPAFEYRGIVFAYMGPPGMKPEFPVFDCMEMPGNEMVPYAIDMPCNWLQVNENPMDPFHAVFLHTRASGVQFKESWDAVGVVDWHWMPDRAGIFVTDTRRWGEFLWTRTAEVHPPNFAQPSDFNQDASQEVFFNRPCASKWIVPVDNTHCRLIAWRHFNDMIGGRPDDDTIGINKVDFLGQTGNERTPHQRIREPGDYEAQVGQGPITIHDDERLGQTDTGVAMLRGLLRRQIRSIKGGGTVPALMRNCEGRVPTYSGDFVLRVSPKSRSQAQQREFGRRLAGVLVDTLPLGFGQRQAEVKRRLLEMRDGGL